MATTVWVAHQSLKVRDIDTPPGGFATSASLFCAKNEFTAFQIAVYDTTGAIDVSVLSGLAGLTVTFYREELYNVTTATNVGGATGNWPDALVPKVDTYYGETRNTFPFNGTAAKTRVVFVDIQVPSSTAAGAITGTVRVSVAGVNTDIPVTVTVWNFAIPSTSTLKSAFALVWNAQIIGVGSDPISGNLAAMRALRVLYIQCALDNRISIDTPDGGQAASPYSSGYSVYDADTGPFLSGTASTRLIGAKLTAVHIEDAIATGAIDTSWSSHFSGKGWSQPFAYCGDEPPSTPWATVRSNLNTVQTAASSVPRLVTTTTQTAAAQTPPVTNINLFCVQINEMYGKIGDPYAGNQRSLYSSPVWWYQSNGSYLSSGWPSYAIDHTGVRNRAMEWMSFWNSMQGELYYETAQSFGTNPYTNQYTFGGNGDGNIYYWGRPTSGGALGEIGGTHHIPIESFRMKQIRNGMQDYELLTLAAAAGHSADAVTLALSIFPNTYSTSPTTADIDNARAQLAVWILGAAPPPPGPQPVANATSSAISVKQIAKIVLGNPSLDHAQAVIVDTLNPFLRSLAVSVAPLSPTTPAGVTQAGQVFWGVGVPLSTLGNNGDVYLRGDTPAVVNQRIYVKSAGAWAGVL
jgi:Domain of unknown function (DUF4091)